MIQRLLTDEERARRKKQILLDNITVEVNGKIFDGNDRARMNILSAIQSATVLGRTSTNWKMADNSIQEVTLDELKQALALAIQKVGEIILNNS